jgi:hypothetical protein
VTTMLPRRFALARHVGDTDEVVAFGVAFTDSHVVLRWHSTHPATSAWNSLDDMLAVLSHREDTIIQWIDALPTELNGLTASAGHGRRARRRAVTSAEEAAASAALIIPDSPANGFQRPMDATERAVSVPMPGQPGRHRRAGQVEHSV